MITIKNIKLHVNRREISADKDLTFTNGLHFIKGVSGSGKTTLLYIIGLVSSQNNYEYYFNNQLIKTQDQKDILKKNNIGFLYQNLNIIEHLNLYQNLELFACLNSQSMNCDIARSLLKKVRMSIDLNRSINSLSGGEKQRFLLACILAKNPEIIIADEPTAALDKENADLMMAILKELTLKENKVVILSTHTQDYDELADSILFISKHSISTIKDNKIVKTEAEETKKRKINSLFYHKFLDHHFTHTMTKYKNVLSISLVLLSLSSFIIQYATNSQNEYKEMLNQTIPNEMIITFDNKNRFDNDITILSKYDGVKNVYPIYKQYGCIILSANETIPVTIYPIFPFQQNSAQAAYGSTDLYPYLSDYLTVETSLDTLEIQLTDVLGQNFTHLYTTDTSPIIFINNEFLDNSQSFFTGKYLLEIESIEYFPMIKKSISQNLNPASIMSSYHSISQLLTSIEQNQYYIYISSITLSIISIILLIFIAYHESSDKYQQLCIYQANGLSKKDLYRILIIETLIKMVLYSLLCFILIYIFIQIANEIFLEYYKMTITILYVRNILLLIFSCLIIPSIIFNIAQIRKPIEKELRANIV